MNRARTARRSAPHVLVVDDRFPHRHLGSGFPRANHLLREMVDLGCQVTLYASDQSWEAWDEVYSDLPRTVECVRGDRNEELAGFLRARKGSFDTIFISRPHNMEAFNRARERDPEVVDGARIVYDAEAVFGIRELLRQELSGSTIDLALQRSTLAAEVDLARPADFVLAVSEHEAEHFRSLPGKEVLVLGHALAAEPTPLGFDERRDFLFVGAFHDDDDPNTESMLWFAREVWPWILREASAIGAKLLVVGKDPPATVRALSRRQGVEIVGPVEHTRPFFENARVCIVPTRFAAGLPYKAHEAAAMGVPIVATELIAEQLGWDDGEEILVARRDSPRDFAERCVRLYTDPGLWSRLREGALERIATECTAEATREVLRVVLGLSTSRVNREAAHEEATVSLAASR